jgi:DNA-binding LacI/PurR family transcriptional regulator
MRVTLTQVAEMAGVSRSAVSRTFTAGASVAPKTRAKVEAAATALGYSPNLLARGLSTRSTGLIGLVSNNFRNPVFLHIFDLFTRALQERGLRPLLVNLSDEVDPARSVQLMRQYAVDGVIVASSTLPPTFPLAFHEAGVPVVHAFGRTLDIPQVHVVGIDNVAAGRMAAQALVARGYARIGFMGGPQSATSTQDRMAGVLQVVPDAACSFAFAYSFDAGRVEMARLLAGTRADAYVCGDDVLAIGALSAVADAGLQVPQDVGIIGLNDMEMAAWANVNLTTVHQPFEAIVAASIAQMVALLATPDAPPTAQVFDCHLVQRGT